uniref:hypothetical protein n=1 Tax=Nonomuraea bangladeshensis TaxID=404385 RepID=UPI003F494BE8
MRKLLTFAAASFFLVFGMAVATPAQAVVGSVGIAVAKTPLRYYDSYYGSNPWWQCYDRGYKGINHGEWYDFECRPGTSWVELWIQVAP